jgi:hypothetical protein
MKVGRSRTKLLSGTTAEGVEISSRIAEALDPHFLSQSRSSDSTGPLNSISFSNSRIFTLFRTSL